MIGVYALINSKNQKAYVGSSNNILRRTKEHLCDLRKNRHYCSYLQKSWNKYQEFNFQIKTLIECKTLNEARELEEAFLECFIDDLYNSKTKAIGFSSEQHPAKRSDWHMKTIRQRLSDDERKQKYGSARGIKRNPEKYIIGAQKRLSDPDYPKRLSDACKGKRKLVSCPHCGLTGGGGNMYRYHFDNCKGKK